MNKSKQLLWILPLAAILITIPACQKKVKTPVASPDSSTTPDTQTKTEPALPEGMILWLKADQVAESGGLVPAWPDKSVKGHQVLQANTDQQPKLIRNAINGKPCLSFDGVDDGLIVQDSENLRPEQIHLFIVCRSESPHTVIIGYPYHANHQNPYYSWTFFHSNAPKGGINLRIGFDDFNTRKTDSWKQNAIYSYTTNPRKLHINGKMFMEKKGKQITYSDTSGLRIGFNADQRENFRGEIAEIILYDHELPDGERQLVEGYLSREYAINLITD